MNSRQLLKETADQKTLDRIAHSKDCPHWSIIENVCECWNYPKPKSGECTDETHLWDDGDPMDCRSPECLGEKIDTAHDLLSDR